jgi:hypothetical protein
MMSKNLSISSEKGFHQHKIRLSESIKILNLQSKKKTLVGLKVSLNVYCKYIIISFTFKGIQKLKAEL